MKKLITLLFASLFFFGYAQKFQLTDEEGNSYPNEHKIAVSITENDLMEVGENLEFSVEVIVQNLELYPLEMTTTRTNLTLVSEMQAYVCFGVCDETYQQLVMEYPIDEKGNLSFSLHLIPNGKIGSNKFKIDFEAEGESMTLYIDIDMQPLGVKEQNNEKVSLSAYPNPVQAGSKMNVTYSIAPHNNTNKLVFRNILGAEVMSIPLNPSEKYISVDTSPLVQGVYFCTIENNNQISVVKKLIVK